MSPVTKVVIRPGLMGQEEQPVGSTSESNYPTRMLTTSSNTLPPSEDDEQRELNLPSF